MVNKSFKYFFFNIQSFLKHWFNVWRLRDLDVWYFLRHYLQNHKENHFEIILTTEFLFPNCSSWAVKKRSHESASFSLFDMKSFTREFTSIKIRSWNLEVNQGNIIESFKLVFFYFYNYVLWFQISVNKALFMQESN